MAQQRLHEQRDRAAHDAAALARLGRIARDGLRHAANDNRARGHGLAGAAVLAAAALAAIAYVVLRWIV